MLFFIAVILFLNRLGGQDRRLSGTLPEFLLRGSSPNSVSTK